VIEGGVGWLVFNYSNIMKCKFQVYIEDRNSVLRFSLLIEHAQFYREKRMSSIVRGRCLTLSLLILEPRRKIRR
jgi:hypothetical protein